MDKKGLGRHEKQGQDKGFEHENEGNRKEGSQCQLSGKQVNWAGEKGAHCEGKANGLQNKQRRPLQRSTK